jgi:hypothetical protein
VHGYECTKGSEMSEPEKKFGELSITERMRHYLQPKGTAPVVQLHLADHGMFKHDFIEACIDELDKMHIRVALGQPPTKLEQLAYSLLCDSAYIDTTKK